MRLFSKALLSFLMVLIGTAGVCFADGFSGTIHFRNGQSVDFNHLGNKAAVGDYRIEGNLGAQKVTYPLSELKEVIFSEATKRYGYYANEKSSGAAIIVNPDGDRFNLTDVCILGDSKRGTVYYVYNDPVTKALMETNAQIKNTISHITIGENSGDTKLNVKTGEYFPALYNYDPFTGDKLIWTKEK